MAQKRTLEVILSGYMMKFLKPALNGYHAEGTACSPINITFAFKFSLQVCKHGGGNCRRSSTCPRGKLRESVGK